MEQITLINGNHRPYTLDLPKVVLLMDNINDVALAHIKENTGLEFVKGWNRYEAQPTESKQIVALMLTYNFKTQYHNNGTVSNTIFLKSDHHVGFDVDSICYDCAAHNGIHLGGLQQGDRLAC